MLNVASLLVFLRIGFSNTQYTNNVKRAQTVTWLFVQIYYCIHANKVNCFFYKSVVIFCRLVVLSLIFRYISSQCLFNYCRVTRVLVSIWMWVIDFHYVRFVETIRDLVDTVGTSKSSVNIILKEFALDASNLILHHYEFFPTDQTLKCNIIWV